MKQSNPIRKALTVLACLTAVIVGSSLPVKGANVTLPSLRGPEANGHVLLSPGNPLEGSIPPAQFKGQDKSQNKPNPGQVQRDSVPFRQAPEPGVGIACLVLAVGVIFLRRRPGRPADISQT